MARVTIVIKGDKQIERKLKRLGDTITDLKRPMDKIGKEAGRYFSNQGFASQGGVFGAPWQRLSPGYAIAKAGKYPGRPPLVKTGKMRNSFTHRSSKDSVIISNNASYFKYHQSTQPRKRLPRRQMMGVNDNINRMVRKHIRNEIVSKLRSA